MFTFIGIVFLAAIRLDFYVYIDLIYQILM
jgi:hypothetical protein